MSFKSSRKALQIVMASENTVVYLEKIKTNSVMGSTLLVHNYHHGEELVPPGLSIRKENGGPIEKGVPDFLL